MQIEIKKIFQLIVRYQRKLIDADVMVYASSTAFYIFVSMIPLIIAVCNLLPHMKIWDEAFVSVSHYVIPRQIILFVDDLMNFAPSHKMTILSLNFVIMIVSASKGVRAMIRGLNHMYEQKESRHIVWIWVHVSTYTLMILFTCLFSMIAIFFGKRIGEYAKLNCGIKVYEILRGIRYFAGTIYMSMLTCSLYYALPSTNEYRWINHLPGAVFSATVQTVYSFGFSLYVKYFGGFTLYGSLTTVIIVLFWLYSCIYIFFCGALLNISINRPNNDF